MSEKNYDFRKRHWQCHIPNRQRPDRTPNPGEIFITSGWGIAPVGDDEFLTLVARDLQDYFQTSMDLSLPFVPADAPNSIVIAVDPARESGFAVSVSPRRVEINSARADLFKAIVHLEDIMNLAGAPALPPGTFERIPLYQRRSVHSGCGIDSYPDEELRALVHAGYDSIELFVKGFDTTTQGHCDFNDVISRAAKFGVKVVFYNYMPCFHHPDEPGVQRYFDELYGELFRRYPGAYGISLVGESLEFPSKDPHTTGKSFRESFVDGIPETRPSPGWYPCCDYPAYLSCIEKAVHAVKPEARVIFSTYNWSLQPREVRAAFLAKLPKNIEVLCPFDLGGYDRKLGGFTTPSLDYDAGASRPSYYFQTETAEAHRNGLLVSGNVNTAGVCWNFGCVPYVPAPRKFLERDLALRQAAFEDGVLSHYCTHHYGWWDCVASDLGKWTSWANFEPDYDQLLRQIAERDYGKAAVDDVLAAWELWSKSLDFYTATNEDQYGPWRVGAAYPFIFHPDITQTMQPKEIKFPTAPTAHFGNRIIKTFYHPFEHSRQSPFFLRGPAELAALGKMLELWQAGLDLVAAHADTPNGVLLEALGHFIRNSIRTTGNIKKWWYLNTDLQRSPDRESALATLGKIRELLEVERVNVKDTFAPVETDSRLGWEPSMEYVCDPWHLDWKLRQLDAAGREIDTYEGIIKL